MRSLLQVFAVILALGQGKNILAVQDQVKVQVYYETLCPDSIEFIVSQLYPAFVTLGSDKIDLELIPWGHAQETTVNGTRTFTCQHGARECYGNKVQSCVIDSTSVEISTSFVFCSERSSAPTDDTILQVCAKSVGTSWSDIEECISSGKADDLLSANGKKTELAGKLTFVPTIILDGKFSQENQDQSITNFKSLICEKMGNPDGCN